MLFVDAMSSAIWLEEKLCIKATQKRLPLGGSLELLPLCNMNCAMCYVRLSREEMERKGRIRSAGEWLDLASYMKKQGVLFLLLTGGEPLLYPEFKELYLRLLDMGFIITINSNGTLMDKAWADFFAGHRPRRINITLYGKDGATYKNLCHYEEGFERTIYGIKLLRERNVDVKLNGSITKFNKDDLGELIRIANELDVPISIDTYMYPAARERDCGFCENARLEAGEAGKAKVKAAQLLLNEEKFEEYRCQMLLKGNQEVGEGSDCSVRCRAGRSSFVVNWQGLMTPCIMLQEPCVNVFNQGFEESWEYMVEEIEKIRVSSRCASCRRRNVCPTCAACALLETGSYDQVPKYLCDYTEAMFKELERS